MNTSNQRTPYSDSLQRAIDYAAKKHIGQKRREQDGTPYIVHPFSVAWILADAGADEDTVIAGLLHDILEDVPGSSYEGLKTDFGEKIANLVRDVSEDKDPNADPSQHLPWLERKHKYLDHLQTADPDTLKVAAADKIHNLRSLRAALVAKGDDIWESFSAPADKRLWLYEEVHRLASERLSDSPLTKILGVELMKMHVETALPHGDPMFHQLEPPTQCHLWKKEVLQDGDLADCFDHVETFEEGSHFSRRLIKCKQCSQFYLSEFYEEIDWEEGEDPQYMTYFPVSNPEEAKTMNQYSPLELLSYSPRIVFDWPKGKPKTTRWIGR